MAADITSLLGSFSFDAPINLAVNVILSTIVMGIVIIVLTKIIARDVDEEVEMTHAFGLALLINIINMPILSALLLGFMSLVPFGSIIIPLLVWIIATKLFFMHIHIAHAAIIGVIGFVLSLLVIPLIVNAIIGFIPL